MGCGASATKGENLQDSKDLNVDVSREAEPSRLRIGQGKHHSHDEHNYSSPKPRFRFSVLVFGSTGDIGRELVRDFLQQKWVVRVATRRPHTPMAKLLEKMGAELVQVDDDRPTLIKAAAMADAGVIIPPFCSDTEICLEWIHALSISATVKRLVAIMTINGASESSELGKQNASILRELKRQHLNFQHGWAAVMAPLTIQGWEKYFCSEIKEYKAYEHPFEDLKIAMIDSRDVSSCVNKLIIDKAKGQVVRLKGPEALTYADALQRARKDFTGEITTTNITPEDWAARWELNPALVRDTVEDLRKHPDVYAETDSGEFEIICHTKLNTFKGWVDAMLRDGWIGEDEAMASASAS